MSSISIKTLLQRCNKNELLRDLIWPAVGGNVAWTFFSVLLTMLQPETAQTPKPEQVAVVRLIAIFLLSCYLGVVYLMSCSEVKDKSRHTRGIFDILHSLTIIFCSIAFQLKFDAEFCNKCLTIFWTVAVVGHLSGAWMPSSVDRANFFKRLSMALVSFIGLGLCWIFSTLPDNWNLVISLSGGLILWGLVRHRIYH